MAIGFLRVSKISRGTGATACARLAYILRSRIRDPRIGTTHDYRRKGADDVLDSGLVGWSGTAEGLAQAMSLAERRGDACEGRSVVLAVPHELNNQQSSDLVAGWCRNLNRRHGVACAWVIHSPDEDGDERNIHAHVIVTSRRSNGVKLGEKARELDDRRSGPAAVEQWRAEWGALAHQALQRSGISQTVDMRSWARRLMADGIPTELVEGDEHLGPARSAAERRGRATAAGKRNRKRRQHRVAVEVAIGEHRALREAGKRAACSTPSGIFEGAMLHKSQNTQSRMSRIGRERTASLPQTLRTANKLLDDLLDQVAKDAKSPDHER